MADEDTGTEQDSTGTGTEEDTTAEGTGQEGQEAEEWTPPTREEWEKQQAEHQVAVERLKAASGESAKRKRELAELRKQHETDAERATREANEAAHGRLKTALMPVAAKAALLEANARPERAAALARLIDHAVVEVSGTDITGLDGEVERLKAEFPEFFRTEEQPVQQQPTPPRTERGTRKPEPVTLSPMEQLAAQISGKK